MYQIKIYKIEEKETEKREYEIIGQKKDEKGNLVKDENGNILAEWGYVNIPEKEEIPTLIYEQTTEIEINVKKVIDAFNQ